MTIAECARRVRAIQIDMLIQEVFDNVKDLIAEMNAEQMEEGKRADGVMIGDPNPNYFGVYEIFREKKGLQTRFIDLKIDGTFHKSIFAELISSEEFRIFSSDDSQKVEELLYGSPPDKKGFKVRAGGFGELIFGLTEENKIKIKEITRDIIIEKLRNEVFS